VQQDIARAGVRWDNVPKLTTDREAPNAWMLLEEGSKV